MRVLCMSVGRGWPEWAVRARDSRAQAWAYASCPRALASASASACVLYLVLWVCVSNMWMKEREKKDGLH